MLERNYFLPLNVNSFPVVQIVNVLILGRSLNVYLLEEGNSLTAGQIWKLTKQALMGLTHIHNFGMIHLDIKRKIYK